MPKNTFRMRLCGNSGNGKTNLLFYMLVSPLIYFEQLYLHAKNHHQDKYKNMIEKMNEISQQVGYDVLVCNNNDIIPVSDIQNTDLQSVVIFDDYVCEKNKKQLIDYFIQGRHKNCSVIYLSQSFYKTPKKYQTKLQPFCNL